MSSTVAVRLLTSSANGPAPAARADCAVADYSANVAGELAVMRPDRDRDDVDLTGHRATELTTSPAIAESPAALMLIAPGDSPAWAAVAA